MKSSLGQTFKRMIWADIQEISVSHHHEIDLVLAKI